MRTKLIRFTLPALATLALAACGGTSDHSGMPHSSSSAPVPSAGGSVTAGDHNDADVAFATGMIPHHGQAITMSDLASKAASDQRVKDLATAIKGAQDPEISLMSGWLEAWGVPVPAATGHAGHDMPGATGDGMMTAEEMTELGEATGAAFDRMWVEMMIRHHEGAVTMSRTELNDGSNAEAKKLAQAIIDGQTREIETMRALLPQLG